MRNRSLAQFLAKSSLIPVAVAIGLLAVSNASAADPVYRWKDANGQSHYSQQPPERGVKYETIAASGAPGSVPVTSAAASGGQDTAPAQKNTTAPAANGTTPGQIQRKEACDTARKNADTLATRPLVSMDLKGTGTAQRLTPDEQTAQLNVAKQQVELYCGNK
jgi:hypothetical protein